MWQVYSIINMKQTILIIAVNTIFIFGALAQPSIGSKAPDIVLPNNTGTTTSLSSLKGKVVLLDFWASWCRPCRQSNHAIADVYNKYNKKGFEIFSVSIDASKPAWQNAVRQDKMKWPQVVDTKAANGNLLTQTWNIQYIPSTFLIDREGVIIAAGIEKDEIEKLLKQML